MENCVVFDIPVVVFIFKRSESLKSIFERIASINPKKLYLIGDGPRNKAEEKATSKCRMYAESLITWKCEVIKNYAETNRGVFSNIGKGAEWVFEKEEVAIFLEDDNLPEVTFFYFCKEMLEKYDNDTRILWICGTNYLESYSTINKSSYVFSKHMLPCGWASWSDKFLKYYDGELRLLEEKTVEKDLKYEYESNALYKQDIKNFYKTKYLLNNNKRESSWDRQIAFSIRVNSLYGIVPTQNQIRNIGVDELSTHGGNSMRKVMTNRFCGIKSFPLEFPLVHPLKVLPDCEFEKKTASIIIVPFRFRLISKLGEIAKKILGLDPYESLTKYLREKQNEEH